MTFAQLVDHPAWIHLGLSLSHFLWQGVAIAILLAFALFALRRQSPQSRHGLCLMALLAMALCPVATLWYVQANPPAGLTLPADRLAPSRARGPDHVAVSQTSFDETTDSASPTPRPRPDPLIPLVNSLASDMSKRSPGARQLADSDHHQTPDRGVLQSAIRNPESAIPHLTWGLTMAAVAWATGVGVLGVRFLFAWLGLCRFRRGSEALPDAIAQMADRLLRHMQITRQVPIRASRAIAEPIAFGLLRPMVLLPASLLTQCPMEVLEAMIAHELAHIRRHDLWINLFQRAVETLLFYHPAVWWVSGRMRLERELCCDDLAVRATGKRADYADALVELSRTLHGWSTPMLTAGMFTSRLSLPARIRRVLQMPATQHDPNRGRYWMTGPITLLLAGSLLLIPSLHSGTAQERPAPGEPSPPDLKASPDWWGIPAEGQPQSNPTPPGETAQNLSQPPRQRIIRPLIDGIVVDLPVSPGQRVKKGDLLVQLDDAEAKLELLAAEARLMLARSKLDHFAKADQAGIVSGEELITMETGLKLAEVDLQKWRLQVERCQIRSPAEGTVGPQSNSFFDQDWAGKAVKAGEGLFILEPLTTTQPTASRPAQVGPAGRGGAATRPVTIVGKNGVYLSADQIAIWGPATQPTGSGVGEPAKAADVFAIADGLVTRVLVKPGQHVKRGDLLVQLDDAEAKLELESAKARLDLLLTQYKTASELVKGGQGSRQELMKTEVELRIAEVAVKKWQLRVERCQIRSPAAGLVPFGYRDLDQETLVGRPVKAGQLLFRIWTDPEPQAGADVGRPAGGPIDWSPYSPAKAQELSRAGKTVLINYTADWCVNGKANEATVLNSEQIRAAVNRFGIVTLKADYTHQDKQIEADLKRFGRAGVPMYVILPANKPDQPILLEETLTKTLLLEALEKAAAKPAP